MKSKPKPDPATCDHDNNHGIHGQVVCLWCGHVIRQMTPEERATDWTWRGVTNTWAKGAVDKLLGRK